MYMLLQHLTPVKRPNSRVATGDVFPNDGCVMGTMIAMTEQMNLITVSQK